MAKTIAAKPQYTNIVKLFNKLTGARQLWELWQDGITMFALMISNTVDCRFRDEREREYIEISHKYKESEMQVFVEIFAEIVNQLEIDQEQDFLGDLYMQLDLGSHWHGQFFTPYNVCQAMAEMTFTEIADVSEVKPISAMDCACGGGALLIAAAHAYRRSIKKTGLNPQNYLSFCAQDISRVTALMCYVQLSLLGYAGKVKIGDSLL
ncbi:MAG: SAM-dependent DNA methyltransferase, partial [Ruminococcus sp.]|nr:SAM-dependent DNA methyltransferase [Ruminococcus sp.]